MALLPWLIVLARAPRSFARPRPYRPFALGLAAGVTYFAGTLYWLADVMVTFGGLSGPAAVAVAALLIAYLALFPAAFSVIVASARRRLGAEALLLAPAVWVATELARGYLLGGFPWALLGYSQVSVLPVAQFASVFGVYGLSALVIVPAACVAYAGQRDGLPRWAALGGAAALVAGLTVWGAARVADGVLLREGKPITVGVVQGNVAQRTKWNPAFASRIFNTYLDLSRQVASRGASLVVWPEASLPFLFEQTPAGAAAVKQLARDTGAFLLIGGDQEEAAKDGAVPDRPPAARPPRPQYYNSAFLVRPDGEVSGVYRKIQLVPFGEYVPFKRLLFFVSPIVEAVGDFSPGERVELLKMGDRGGLTTAICYEVIFPWLAREAVLAGSQLLTTITNDAWYGTSSAPYQHFEQARMRAIEQGRFLVRAANTGISGAIDPYGRVIARTALFVPAAETIEVRLLDGRTLYARIGDAFAYACLAATAAAIALVLKAQS